ncbi:hypothetical protein HYC85_028325 [Camellia sinensis]|uniref:Uncharacterized protein n=1 Tax=Camellia sinensis TaxID=4442 RepID=A0A7J7FYV9_CAMSI|nr:hypothetical protein HYC85_028325 [Camellia sinensis]
MVSMIRKKGSTQSVLREEPLSVFQSLCTVSVRRARGEIPIRVERFIAAHPMRVGFVDHPYPPPAVARCHRLEVSADRQNLVPTGTIWSADESNKVPMRTVKCRWWRLCIWQSSPCLALLFQKSVSQNDLPDLESLVQIKNRDTNRVQTVFSIIASNPVDIPQALWIRGRRLHRSEDLIEGQPVYHSLPPVTKRKATRRRISVQQSVQRASSTPPVYSRDQDPVSPTERERIPAIQPEQNSMASLEEMVCQLQESMKMMQQDAARQAEFARQ